MGALFTSGVQCELIGPVLPLFWNQCYPQFDLQLAPVLGSIKQAVNELKICYPQGQPVKTENIENDCPYITSFQAAGKTYQFEYSIDQPLKSHNIFIARDPEKKLICVKFTRRYSEEVHRFCEERHLAPKLIAVNKISAGWISVVTEYLEGYQHWKEPSIDIQNQLRTLVSDLHERGLVHGDIQKENLLVGPEHGKKKALKLIDFDYAGREGEACHPPHLHPDIEAATDAYRHGPITYKHDIDMLEKLCLGVITSSQGVTTRSRTRAHVANIRTNLKV